MVYYVLRTENEEIQFCPLQIKFLVLYPWRLWVIAILTNNLPVFRLFIIVSVGTLEGFKPSKREMVQCKLFIRDSICFCRGEISCNRVLYILYQVAKWDQAEYVSNGHIAHFSQSMEEAHNERWIGKIFSEFFFQHALLQTHEHAE